MDTSNFGWGASSVLIAKKGRIQINEQPPPPPPPEKTPSFTKTPARFGDVRILNPKSIKKHETSKMRTVSCSETYLLGSLSSRPFLWGTNVIKWGYRKTLWPGCHSRRGHSGHCRGHHRGLRRGLRHHHRHSYGLIPCRPHRRRWPQALGGKKNKKEMESLNLTSKVRCNMTSIAIKIFLITVRNRFL